MKLARQIIGLFLLLCCAGAMVAPAAARDAHGLVHVEAPVNDGEYHHHGSNRSSTVVHGDAEADSDPQDDGIPDQTGHSHMSFAASDLAIKVYDPLLMRVVVQASPLVAAHTSNLETRGSLPLIRPPITA